MFKKIEAQAKKCFSYKKGVCAVRRESRTATTSKMERFMIIVNGFQPLPLITKCSILDAAAALDPPLNLIREAILYHL